MTVPKGMTFFKSNWPLLCLLFHGESPSVTLMLCAWHQNLAAMLQKQLGSPACSRSVLAPSAVLRTVRSQYALFWCLDGVALPCGTCNSLIARMAQESCLSTCIWDDHDQRNRAGLRGRHLLIWS